MDFIPLTRYWEIRGCSVATNILLLTWYKRLYQGVIGVQSVFIESVMTLPQSGRLDGCEQPQGLPG
jgi:hypothetical protein